MQIRIKIRHNSSAEGYTPFGLLPVRYGFWLPFSWSLFAHVGGLWLGLSIWSYWPVLVTEYNPMVRKDRVIALDSEPLEARQLVAPASAPAAASAPRPAADRSRGPARLSAALTPPTGTPAAPAPALATKQFRMPEQYVLKPVPQTLVQLELPPTLDSHQQLRVPALVILSDASVRRPPPKPFIAPPPKNSTAPVPSEVALDMHAPILEAGPGYAKMTDVLKRANPNLPTPVGAMAPVAGNQPSVPSKQAANVTGNEPSDAVNIVSVPDHPIPLASAIVLPPLNQVASSLPGGLGTQDGPGATGVNGKAQAGGATAVNTEGTVPAGSGLHPESASSGGNRKTGAAPAGPGSGNSAAGGAGSSSNAGANLGTRNGAGTAASGAEAGAGSKTGSQDPVKINRAKDGQYGLAVVQSSSGVPGSAGLLKGRPVFSVYLAIGARKEWILQYCLPADSSKQAPAQVVQLSNVSPVGAPYAFTIVRPIIHLSYGARYGFVHGFVNTSGKFERLSEAGEPVIDNIAALLGALEQWEFRPASKDGVPTEVEVLLCIPNSG